MSPFPPPSYTQNLFSNYSQAENHFTNGLLSILRLSAFDGPNFIGSFLRHALSLTPAEPIKEFKVLQNIDGTADAELTGDDCCIRFETKIVSATLRDEQIRMHLDYLNESPKSLKRLVLLTPDDGRSQYVQTFLLIDQEHLQHVGWKSVYSFFNNWIGGKPETVFAEIVRQFLERIRQTVFEQDIAGIIAKVDFGKKSGVFDDQYLTEMKNGEWTIWNTPRQYKSLDGTGRKLMLYDRTRRAITLEVEIKKVSRTDSEPDYPWTNVFAPGTLFVFGEPITLDRIRAVRGFESFGVHPKDRSPYRNMTHEQYRQLRGGQGDILLWGRTRGHSRMARR
jgi:hypothetical protein